MTSPYLERIRRSEAEVLTAIKTGAAGKERTKLKAINADLLAALEGIIDLIPTDCQHEARAAIAKARHQ